MDHFLKLLAYDCGLSQTQYWHLRLLSSISLVPLLGVLYLVVFDKPAPRKPRPADGPQASMWVGSDGRLYSIR